MWNKNRKWCDDYVKFGFTNKIGSDGIHNPQCMICQVIMKNSCLVPSKLSKHFLNSHGDGKYKDATVADFTAKRIKFDERITLPNMGFLNVSKPLLTASYEVSYLIAKQGKPHSIGENLVKPAAIMMADILLGNSAKNKFSQVSLSNNTVRSRIVDMSKDILAQVINDLTSSPERFSLQLDESTDVSNMSQLIVFVRYMKDDDIVENFLFCKPLVTTTKATDIKQLIGNFFNEHGLSWNMVSAICSDGAPAMLGRNSGFGMLVKKVEPDILITHCVLHRHALATKTLPPMLAHVLKIVVECVNYIRHSALNHRIFQELCNEMGSDFDVLLYHSNVRWLSRGKVLNRVFSLRLEIALFLEERHHIHVQYFKNPEFILILAYLSDIFNFLNCLNQKMQGGGVNIIEAEESLNSFKKNFLYG